MRVDKFGVGALVIGLIIIFAMLNFVFMQPAGGWSWQGLWNAIVVTVEGAVVLLGLLLIVIGLLLIVL